MDLRCGCWICCVGVIRLLRLLIAAGFPAEEVWKGLGFGVRNRSGYKKSKKNYPELKNSEHLTDKLFSLC